MINKLNKEKSLCSVRMKGSILEVMLVSGQGIGHSSIIGKHEYHVIVECGTQICRTKTSSGHRDKVYWNEKITFELTQPELENLNHLTLKIVNEKYFDDDEFVGETIIFLKGIILEGNYYGVIDLNPTPYNVVLEDDSYKGHITIGLKFIADATLQMKRKENVQEENELIGKSICKSIMSFWKMQWWRLLFSYKNLDSTNRHKHN